MNAQRVLISGANRGLGLELARAYLEAGHSVAAGARDPGSPGMAALAGRFPAALKRLPLDVSDEASVDAAALSLATQWDGLDLLINNAAVNPPGKGTGLANLDFRNALHIYDINALGPLRVAKHFAALLKKGRPGRALVNVSSEAGSIANCWRDDEFPYPLSKSALNMATAVLARGLKKDGIRVLSLHPGWFKSDMGGPNAELGVAEAAGMVVRAIEGLRGDLDGPVYVDGAGKPMPW